METSPASGTSETADASAAYALGYGPVERDRLLRQPDELREDSEVLLDRAGVAEGSSVIDLGCGPQGILDLLADRAGPAGRVTGVDFHPASVAQARTFVAERGYQNVRVIEGDACCTGLPSGSYDLVHARTLLVNAPDPAAVLTEMVRLARPGGAGPAFPSLGPQTGKPAIALSNNLSNKEGRPVSGRYISLGAN